MDSCLKTARQNFQPRMGLAKNNPIEVAGRACLPHPDARALSVPVFGPAFTNSSLGQRSLLVPGRLSVLHANQPTATDSREPMLPPVGRAPPSLAMKGIYCIYPQPGFETLIESLSLGEAGGLRGTCAGKSANCVGEPVVYACPPAWGFSNAGECSRPLDALFRHLAWLRNDAVAHCRNEFAEGGKTPSTFDLYKRLTAMRQDNAHNAAQPARPQRSMLQRVRAVRRDKALLPCGCESHATAVVSVGSDQGGLWR